MISKKTGEHHKIKYTAQAMFHFHQVNAYEKDDQIIMDMSAYENADIVHMFYLTYLRKATQEGTIKDYTCGQLWRFVLPLHIGKVKLSILLYWTQCESFLYN